MLKRNLLIIGTIIVLYGCQTKNYENLLVPISSSNSGIDFENKIIENDSINVIDFQYCYNGGGVGVGDFNNDGWPDVVFSGNQVESRIYLNRKSLRFEDVTNLSGLNTKDSWVTGVTVVDINTDGLDDIYFNVAGPQCNNDCNNLLFVNQGLDKDGIPKFDEKAAAYGLQDGNYSQQSVFFDYDGDGDLDVFILHNGNHGFDKNNPMPKQYMQPHLKDFLLRNDSVPGFDHPVFTDVSRQSGIVFGGFGLGVGINDINKDGLIDIYVANDFITEDLLYVQKRHKDSLTPWFEELSKTYIPHFSHNAMGMDFADIDNDALPDVMVVDMMPEQYERQKRMLGSMNYERYLLALRNGYGSQYVHNTLQLNNGSIDSEPLKFSEVGFMAGIASTDWSWAPLMVDLDNDGDKDIYISNGYIKDVADLDYINYSSENNMFGDREYRVKNQKKFANKLKSIHLPNYIFENTGKITFNDVSRSWTNAAPSFTNGVSYADFDKDGDLDLMMNNINEPATLLENRASEHKENHYLQVKLKGNAKNPSGIGSEVKIWEGGKVQSHFQSVVRGYLSSVEPIAHFGVNGLLVDSIRVQWPDGRFNAFKSVPSDQVLEISYSKSKLKSKKLPEENEVRPFQSVPGIIPYKHKENNFNEYAIQPLLMRQYAQMGPCTAAANIDGVPGDEIFIGGSKNEPGEIWVQAEEDSYQVRQQLDSSFEDTDAVFVDVDNDSDFDLIVTSGGSEFGKKSDQYADRLYLNDGRGFFQSAVNLFPGSNESTQVVRPADFDNDGDMDLFIGSRIVPGSYPQIPESKILVNENGKFLELSKSGIHSIGMVTDAIWEDIDKDGRMDLLVVGEWMPITIYRNDPNGFTLMDTEWIDENDNTVNTKGWWNCIAKADFDNDGDMDFVVGNQGLNGALRPTQSEPIYLFKGDFDNNGSNDPVLGKYFDFGANAVLMPLHTRDDIVAQLPILKRKYLRYDDFTEVNFNQLLEIEDLKSQTLSASMFTSSYVENLGEGKFKISSLPQECQIAVINDLSIANFYDDDELSVLLVGNDFTSEAIYGKSDALTGLLLKWNNGVFKTVASKESGFYVPGQSHNLMNFTDRRGYELVLASQNSDSVLIYAKRY